jgi:hypothetical protein
VAQRAAAPLQPADLQDRLGAQAAYDLGPDARSGDPWTDLAAILLRMISSGAGAAAPLLPAPSPTRPGPTDATDRGAGANPPDSPLPEPLSARVPEDEATGSGPMRLPDTAANRALRGETPAPGPVRIAAPDLPRARDAPLPGAAIAGPVPVAAPAGPPTAPVAAPGPADGSTPGAIVRRWTAGVRAGGAGIPTPGVTVLPEARATVSRTAAGAARRNGEAREGLAASAVATVPAALRVEDAPPPPPSNPVPDQTAAVLALSDLRLPDQAVPPLAASARHSFVDIGTTEVTVGGTMPRIGDSPVANDLFNIVTSPDASRLADRLVGTAGAPGAATAPTQEAQRAAEALAHFALRREAAAGPVPQGRGEQVITPDTGPQPVPPLPPGLQTPVAEVVARLLAQTGQTTTQVLDRMREAAYRGGVLRTLFPAVGESLAANLQTEVSAELRAIAAAANVSSADLDQMVTTRRQKLAQSGTAARDEAAAVGAAARTEAAGQGQQTMDAIAGAADLAREETVRRQEQAGGAADPTIINARRDLTIGWVRSHVTTQITDYQTAGDRRSRELTAAQAAQTAAYQALAQREKYDVLTPRDPRPRRDTTDLPRERRLADATAVIGAAADIRLREVGEAFRIRITRAATLTTSRRREIETAGSTAISAARTWAVEKIHENDSWWQRMTRRFQAWFAEADTATETWQVRRTRENRDAVARDLDLVQTAQRMLDEGLTREQILQDRRLGAAEQAVIAQFFALPPGTHPLEFAAGRLRNTLAADHLAAAKTVFEEELIATPVGYQDFAGAEKILAVARAEGGGFNAEQIVTGVHAAMDQWGTEEAQIYSQLNGLTRLKGAAVRKLYFAQFGSSLDKDLSEELSGDELSRAQAQLEGRAAQAEAIALHDAIAGPGTDEAAIMQVLRNKTPAEVEAIRAEYLSRFGETLDAALAGDLAEGNELDQAQAHLSGNTERADAIALDDAMRGGLTGWGTDEGEVERIQNRVRDEVLARARSEGWSSQQMEAEVRRRMGRISAEFESRYGTVEEYRIPGRENEPALSRAFRSELSGPERDLAQALQDNDLVAADSARIEIERTGFYASDEKINGVLRSQYERALQARRLDEGPARGLAVEQAVRQARAEGKSEDEVSRIRMAMERQMERELGKAAQADSRLTMSQLQETYQDRYTWPLDFVVSWNTSGQEHAAARSLLAQGGRLEPIQELEYATRGPGTDVDALRRTFSSMTHAQIMALRKEWAELHPDEPFYDMLVGELSGRDRSDILDMAIYGAPESALEEIARERRRVDREREDLTGVLGRSVTAGEEAWMEHQQRQLEALEGPLRRTDWPDTPEGQRQREELQGEVGRRVAVVQDAVADHRRRLDSFTDMATQAIGIVVGLTVAVVLGAVSGGTLGVATIALMASLMATAATMTTKALLLGGAYGEEDMAVDLAVGAVDAVTAMATAGLGTRLLKPLQAAAGRLPVGQVAGWLGRTGVARRAATLPGASGAAALARRAIPPPAAVNRMASSLIADSIEDAAGALPSAFVQMALTDSTWRGDPLMNFLEGGGMALIQSVAMGRGMAAGSGAAGHAFTSLRGRFRMHTDLGRTLELGRLVQDRFGRFAQDNPGASMAQFMAHPEGRALRAEIETRGLMPDVEAATRAVEGASAAPPVRTDAADPGAGPAPDPRAAALALALPAGLREGSFVTPDPDLPGRTVRVEPLRIGNQIVGVDIRVGPGATPLDIALHAPTVHAMQKYRGVLGDVRRVLEDTAARLTGSGLTVGSRGWEARLELGKLYGVIGGRMEALGSGPEGGALSPRAEALLLGDIRHLEGQLAEHQAILADPDLRSAPGRGYVAAEGLLGGAGFDADWRAGLHDPSTGALTEKGHVDLEYRINRMRSERRSLLASDRHDKYDPALLPKRLGPLLQETMALYGLSQSAILSHLAEPKGRDGIGSLLDASGLARPQIAQPAPDPIVGHTPARRGDQVLADKIDGAAPYGPRLPQPEDIVRRIAAGDATAQTQMKAISPAPTHYEVRNVTTDDLDAAMPHDYGTYVGGFILVGDGVIPITKNKPTAATPDPQIQFHGEFPPYSKAGNNVLQLENGGLRVWREKPTSEFPEGRLIQESIVGPRQDRKDYETIHETYSEAGLVGPPTELGHVHGAGRGIESPFGILHVPVGVNQALQRLGIERFLSNLYDNAPPNTTFHYVTEVAAQANDEMRLGMIRYRIDVTINGQRMPFAEFGIRVDPLPAHIRPERVTEQNIVSVEPISFRDHTDLRLSDILGEMRELVNVPTFVVEGLPRLPPPDRAAQLAALQASPPNVVAAAAQRSRRLAAVRPQPAESFDVVAWRRALIDRLSADPGPQYVVVDLRGLGLNPEQIAAVTGAIGHLPQAQRDRVLLVP